MTTDVIIKHATASDVAAFRLIRLEALPTERGNFASAYEDWAEMPVEEWTRRVEDEPVFLAFRGEEPVGIMGLMRQHGIKMMHRASLIMVYVRKDLRGSGVARDTLNAIIEQASTDGIRQLELHANAGNPTAIRFYEREGFFEVGRIPGAVMEQGGEIDHVVMVRRLVEPIVG